MRYRFVLIIIFLFDAILLFSCKDANIDLTTPQPVISDSLINILKTSKAVMADNDTEIKLNGKIEVNESKVSKVYAMVSGRVQSMNAELGDCVARGQKLAVLYSTEAAVASGELAAAEANLKMAEKKLQSVKDLFNDKLATGQDYNNASHEYDIALSSYSRARQVSSITGGHNETVVLTAPISGYIIDKNLSGYSEIRQDNDAVLFTIADLSEVWVMANVYETDIRGVRAGDEVVVSTLAFPEKNYTGIINKVYKVLDPVTRTMRVRINLKNENQELRPEMFATIRVKAREAGQTLAVPSDALVMENSRYYVIIRNSGKLYVQEVNLLKRTEDKAFVRGIMAGDEVVTTLQVFLYQALTGQ